MPKYYINVIYHLFGVKGIELKKVQEQILIFGGTPYYGAIITTNGGSFTNMIDYNGNANELDNIMNFNEKIRRFAMDHSAEVSCSIICGADVMKYHYVDMRTIKKLECTIITPNEPGNIETLHKILGLDMVCFVQCLLILDHYRIDAVALNELDQKLETIPFYQELLKMNIDYTCNINYGTQILHRENKKI